VLMKAISSVRRYTAASSLVSKPTKRLASAGAARDFRASDRTVGPIFAAQPQVRASPVSVFLLRKILITPDCTIDRCPYFLV
jgi:hypothetical protein